MLEISCFTQVPNISIAITVLEIFCFTRVPNLIETVTVQLYVLEVSQITQVPNEDIFEEVLNMVLEASTLHRYQILVSLLQMDS